MNKLLEIKNLKKYYHDSKGEVLAIDNISLTVNENEFISIIGTSGCGKSTLLSILAGLINKSSGKIIFNKSVWRNTFDTEDFGHKNKICQMGIL